MDPKIKNIILFTVIAAALILVYIFFIKKDPEEADLSSVLVPVSDTSGNVNDTIDQNSIIARDFLAVLLSVKSVKLNESIFSDNAFINLHDSTIILSPPGPEDKGRPNPFAPLGRDVISTPPSSQEILN